MEAQKTETKLVIIKTFVGINALARAVEFANMDLSYNKKLALADIAETQKGFGRYSQNNMQAFVVEGEKSLRVFYTFKCDIVLLNEYVPFLSMLTDSNFGIAQVKDSTLTISCQGEFTRECLRKMQTGMFQELDLYGYK